jgi:hypothetical protein
MSRVGRLEKKQAEKKQVARNAADATNGPVD